jgi:hypothetical protein
MYIQEPSFQNPEHLGWFVDRNVGHRPTPTGHETLTSQSAQGILTNATDLQALIDGVRRPDMIDPNDHIKLGEQRRHFLKADLKHSSLFAWWESIHHFRLLHQQILVIPGRLSQLALIGEAMHLIQDSFAPAHVVRDPKTREITQVRYYGPGAFPSFLPMKATPQAHTYLVDPEDNIFMPSGGTLKPEAQEAVQAGREYLSLALRHLGLTQPQATAQIEQELEDFISRRLWFNMPMIRPGSRGPTVSVLQQRLNRWLKKASNPRLPLLPVSGIFGRQTTAAVKAFQKEMGLKVDGLVGWGTWLKLRNL